MSVNSVTISYLTHMTVYYTMRQILLQNEAAILLQNATVVYYKISQVFYYKLQQFYYKMRQLLQNATFILFITNCENTDMLVQSCFCLTYFLFSNFSFSVVCEVLGCINSLLDK